MKMITEYLPKDWERKAKELGAMSRNSGVIRNAKSLLRLNIANDNEKREWQISNSAVSG